MDRYRNLSDAECIVYGIIFVVLVIAMIINACHTDTYYNCTVQDKVVVTHTRNKSGHHTSRTNKVKVVLEDGTTMTIRNTNSIFKMKFNSKEIQDSLVVGNTYTIHTYGFILKNIEKIE